LRNGGGETAQDGTRRLGEDKRPGSPVKNGVKRIGKDGFRIMNRGHLLKINFPSGEVGANGSQKGSTGGKRKWGRAT